MSIRCPNYLICKNHFLLSSDEDIEDGNIKNEIYIRGIGERDATNEYTIIKLHKPLPVCWECGTSYSSVEDEHQNKYLSFIDSTECCICLTTGKGVSFPNCLHYTCIPCHNRCWFGPEPIKLEFPYCENVKKLYLSDIGNSIWKTDPKIKEYIEKESKLENERMEQWEREINLRKCPLCRI